MGISIQIEVKDIVEKSKKHEEAIDKLSNVTNETKDSLLAFSGKSKEKWEGIELTLEGYERSVAEITEQTRMNNTKQEEFETSFDSFLEESIASTAMEIDNFKIQLNDMTENIARLNNASVENTSNFKTLN